MHSIPQMVGPESSSPAGPSTLREQLRNGTAASHRDLEARLNLLRPELNVAEYQRTLERFYGFYRPWEAVMRPLLAEALPGFYDQREKLPLLSADLRRLGVIPDDLPLCRHLPPLPSFAAALGSLYVIEGSTLGGQLLHRHLTRQLSLPSEAVSFFGSYREHTSARWREFLAILEQYDCPGANETTVRAACATFQSMDLWFAEVAG